MISYTLDMDPKKIKPRSEKRHIHGMLAEALRREEKRGTLPKGAVEDVVRLVSGLSTEIMISAYLDQHVCPGPAKGGLYNKDMLARLVKIILLGIKQYYKDKK